MTRIRYFGQREWGCFVLQTLALARAGMMALLALCAMVTVSHAQPTEFPTRKPIQLVIPYPAGGSSDVIARTVNTPLSEEIGQHVIVENIAGGTGTLGAKKVLNNPNDGYMVFQGSANEVILAAMLNPSAQYRPEDFRLVQPITESVIVLLAHQSVAASSLDELIEAARQAQANPLTYATVGQNSQYHLMGEMMTHRTGAHLMHIPYKGAAPALQDLVGGQVKLAILPYQPSMDDFVKQGRIKILVGFTRAKSLPPSLQHLATIDSSKILNDFEHFIGSGFYVRKDTPEPIVEKLRIHMGKTLQRSEVRAALEATGRIVMPAMTGAQAAQYQSAEMQRYKEMLKFAGTATNAL